MAASYTFEHERFTRGPRTIAKLKTMKNVVMKHPWTSRFAILCAGAAVMVGCESGDPTGESDETTDESTEAISATSPSGDEAEASDRDSDRSGERGPRGKHGHFRRGGHGPDRLVHAALRGDLDLTDAQRAAIEATISSKKPRDGHDNGERSAEHAERTQALAAAIRAGSVDASTFGDKADHGQRHAERRAEAEAALNTLHATLTPEQRVALVASMKAKEDMPSRMHGPGEADGPMRRHGKGFGKGSPVDVLLKGVTLHDGQRERIDAALESAGVKAEPPSEDEMKAMFEEHRAAKAAFLDAFAKDTFDAKTSMPAGPKRMMKHGPKQFGESLAVVVPLLDAEQREALATQIEEGPRFGDHVRRKRGPGPARR